MAQPTPTDLACDAISPQTWTLKVVEEGSQRPYAIDIHVSFRHLRITSLEHLRDDILKREPNRFVTRTKALGESPAGAIDQAIEATAEGHTLGCVRSSTLDLSRNFLKECDLPLLVDAVGERLISEAENGTIKAEPSTLAQEFREHLTKLTLSSNEVSTFPQGTDQNFSELKEIYISHNRLVSGVATPCGEESSGARDSQAGHVEASNRCNASTPSLRLLDLRNNRLTDLSTFKSLLSQNAESLEHFSLSCNKITLKALEDLPRLPRLKVLGLFGSNISASPQPQGGSGVASVLALIASKCPHLEDLYLLGSPCTETSDALDAYESEARKVFCDLKFLDGRLLVP